MILHPFLLAALMPVEGAVGVTGPPLYLAAQAHAVAARVRAPAVYLVQANDLTFRKKRSLQ
jgi:hypothetical protein